MQTQDHFVLSISTLQGLSGYCRKVIALTAFERSLECQGERTSGRCGMRGIYALNFTVSMHAVHGIT
jgi:hypothetical protein